MATSKSETWRSPVCDQAHNTPVYTIHWNSFITDLFITCAFEFTVKIWHKDSSKPVWRFDLGSQVGDVAWAPYSSTIFAAVTWEGKVFVYDLSVNKYNPVCVQVKSLSLTPIVYSTYRVDQKKVSRDTELGFFT